MSGLRAQTAWLYLRIVLQAGAAATVVTSLALTAILSFANPSLTVAGIAELAIAMLWLEAVAHVVLISSLTVLWFPLRLLLGWQSSDWRAYLISGLIACHLGGLFFSRLTLTQTWLRLHRVITWAGLAQCAAIVAMGLAVIVAGVLLRRSEPARTWGTLLAIAAVLGLGCLAWDAKREGFHRIYPLEQVREAAALQPAALPQQPGEKAPVVLLGLDGLEWSVMKPLLGAGKLPNFARLIKDGAIGYLDNGDLSYSPVIWNTVFTGRSESGHGIHDFRELTLPRTGQIVSKFPVMLPTPHAFYGIRNLVEKIPSAGLWRMRQAASTQRQAKTLWEIASGYQKQVAVANPLTSTPVQPVYGSMIVYRTNTGPTFAYPPELAAEWGATLAQSGSPRRDWLEEYAQPGSIRVRSRIEAEFTLDLFYRDEFDLAVYYEPLVDEMGHLGWNFYAQNDAVIMSLPSGLDNREWEELVLTNIENRVFAAYVELDALVGEFLSRGPVNFVIASDHGWTFSGYEHYGSPDGIIVLSGPAFRSGVNLSGARIEDIAPTVLSIMGIPLSRELEGRLLLEALIDEPEQVEVASYGAPVHTRKQFRTVDDAEELERLKALGYIQ